MLTWNCPETVWAMDHAKPPEPVDGTHAAAFALSDLSSRYRILWEPVADFTAETVVGRLDSRFRNWGPPLVLKSDSGPAFIAEALEAFLRSWGVKNIWSPPRRPQYNGRHRGHDPLDKALDGSGGRGGGAWRSLEAR